MTLVIPANFKYRSRVYKLGKDNLILTPELKGITDYEDLYKKHHLFKAMIRYIVSPSLETNVWDSYDSNIQYYLDAEFINTVAQDNPDLFKISGSAGFDVDEYKDYINDAWDKIRNMTVEDFLFVVSSAGKDKSSIVSAARDKSIIQALGESITDEGKSVSLTELKDEEGRIGSHALDKVQGFTTKDLKAKRLYQVANAQNEEDRVYEEAFNDDTLEDYTEYHIEFKKGDAAEEFPLEKGVTITVELDLEAFFRSKMESQGIEMPFRPSRKIKDFDPEAEVQRRQDARESKDTLESEMTVSEAKTKEEDYDVNKSILKSLETIKLELKSLLKEEVFGPQKQPKRLANYTDNYSFINSEESVYEIPIPDNFQFAEDDGELVTYGEASADQSLEVEKYMIPYMPEEYDGWDENERRMWHQIMLKYSYNKLIKKDKPMATAQKKKSPEYASDEGIWRGLIKTLVHHQVEKTYVTDEQAPLVRLL